MFVREFIVVTERFKGRSQTENVTETFESETDVAGSVMYVSREFSAVPSGMEGFGEGICVLEDTGHDCTEDSWQCGENEHEGARRWIVKRLGDMGDGESTSFHISNGHDWAFVTVTVRESV